MRPAERLIVALDFDAAGKALSMAEILKPAVGYFKIGLELFSSAGPDIVKKIRDMGCNVFLDLKFHDIPNTVSGAVAAAARLGANIVNVHALGGYEMMKAAADSAARCHGTRPKVIAVTILTSMDENALKKTAIDGNIQGTALRLACLAKESGMDGVVASAKEAAAIRQTAGEDFLIVTPGVRPKGADSADQKRVVTPEEAIAAGADYIVVGRPITGAKDPLSVAKNIIEDIGE
jgi:orotidine-5'-phosphate decarboxylase